MKFQHLVIATGILASPWIAAAAPEADANANPKVPEKSLKLLIEELADDQFRIREEATQQLWRMGERALPELRNSATQEDPERAYRAKELVRKIQLRITPETDPEVIELVERYKKASPNEKNLLFEKLKLKRAWWQLLKLYSSETDAALMSRLAPSVEGIALSAAREKLLQGDADNAREYLEMAPVSASGLLSLADFHRSQGTLQATLERAKTVEGNQSAAWQLALHRAAGNLESARDAAIAAGEVKIAASMSTLLGDPLPWLKLDAQDPDHRDDNNVNHAAYIDLAIQRWLGKPIQPEELNKFTAATNSPDRSLREQAISALFLLGETAIAEEALLKNQTLQAFAHFEMTERIPEALRALGINPENPDYSAWVESRIKNFGENDADNGGEDEDQAGNLRMNSELFSLAHFLEQRGMREEFQAAFLKPLADLAAAEEERFIKLMSIFLSASSAPEFSMPALIAWAGENEGRWDSIVTSVFGIDEHSTQIWNWLGELDPKATLAERFEGMQILRGIGRDPRRLGTKWSALAWQAIEKTPKEDRAKFVELMAILSWRGSAAPDSLGSSDVTQSLKIWDQLPEESRQKFPVLAFIRIKDLSAVGRWNEAAAYFLGQIENTKQNPNPALYAYAAACLRRAGRVKEAISNDQWADKLALGKDAAEIATAYAYADDFEKSAEWSARAARHADPTSGDFVDTLQRHLEVLKRQEKWQQVASVSEVLANYSTAIGAAQPPLILLKFRFESDFGNALAKLQMDRPAAIKMLEKCYKMYPSDGSLADDFFPTLRKVGLLKEHDEWFDQSWARLVAVCEKYPDSDNTLNTTAWLASRAQRNLDEAEKLETRALQLNPDQATYLDTMAEVHFAKGNRAKAIEFSDRAINFLPADPILRRQNQRFRKDPLPKGKAS